MRDSEMNRLIGELADLLEEDQPDAGAISGILEKAVATPAQSVEGLSQKLLMAMTTADLELSPTSPTRLLIQSAVIDARQFRQPYLH